MPANTKPSAPIYVATCCLFIILALVLGVGLASNLVLRHIVQTAPLWVAVALGFRRSHAAPWVALPFFLFWLPLMALIWAYLLGISTFFSGQFSPVEIAMTFVVGAASIVGIICFFAFKSDLSRVAGIGLFVMMAVIQWGCFRLSFVPAIAHR